MADQPLLGEGADDEEDGFTELRDARFSRIDLVGKGANGYPFLIAKADPAGGLLPSELVRELVETNDPAPVTKARDDVTISGSPAAVMRMIHEAAQRATTRTPLKGGDMDDVTKADAPGVEAADIVGDAAGGSTAESQPGSPDWEALDAETALNAISVLGRVKGALEWLAGREAAEAVTEGGDGADVFDLEDAACQLDCIIRRLAGFAATETLESEVSEEIDDVTKAAAAAARLAEPLAVLEQYGPVLKAGRVLSTANEQRVRDASSLLQEVLATLPAPVQDDVAKGDATMQDVNEPDPAAAVEAAAVVEPVEKAKTDPVMAVFDSSGNLVGTIDPADLAPIAATAPPSGGDSEGDDGDSDGDAAAAADDLEPAPAADAGVPATAPAAAPAAAPVEAPKTDEDGVTKADSSENDVLKEALASAVEAALQDHPVVKALQERIEHLEAPAPSKVVSNGYGSGPLPVPALMRGQDSGAPLDSITKEADELRERVLKAGSVEEREEAQRRLNEIGSQVLSSLWAQSQADRTARRG